jgi:hypothetical protein
MHKPVEASGNADPTTSSSRLPLSRFKVIDLTLARAAHPAFARWPTGAPM